MTGVQYLDELFSAIRDTADQLGAADSWLAKADASPHLHWRMSFLQAARNAHLTAQRRFGDANRTLATLGPPDRLPSLLAGIPERLGELRTRLEASEKRLGSTLDRVMQTPRGQA
ncbi:MAG TPA: hypothetical protein PK156_17250 [Polyangium sp.]|nr:hypothetical protein [Polyangium sp.]